MSIPADTQSIIHLAVFLKKAQETALPADLSSGADANKKHGAVVPVRAMTGPQQFACCLGDGLVVNGKKVDLCMSKHAGKLYEGAMHAATDDAQFVSCPFCKETQEYKDAIAEHERWTASDKGVFGGVFRKT